MAIVNLKKPKLTIRQLRKVFYLDGSVVRWKVKTRKTNAGQVAGCKMASGHYNVNHLGQKYYCHRIAFALYHGRWPKGLIDHIDGNPANNHPDNLREVCDSQNNFNQKIKCTNKTGIVGVSRHTGGFHAEISAYKVRYRKWFKTLGAAKSWVDGMRLQLHHGMGRVS